MKGNVLISAALFLSIFGMLTFSILNSPTFLSGVSDQALSNSSILGAVAAQTISAKNLEADGSVQFDSSLGYDKIQALLDRVKAGGYTPAINLCGAVIAVESASCNATSISFYSEFTVGDLVLCPGVIDECNSAAVNIFEEQIGACKEWFGCLFDLSHPENTVVLPVI